MAHFVDNLGKYSMVFLCFFFLFFSISWAIPLAYGGSHP